MFEFRCSVEVPLQCLSSVANTSKVGIYGSSVQDVELVAKSKRAKTVKSGLTSSNNPGHEKCVQELLMASEFWSSLVKDYYECSVKSKVLTPKMEEQICQLRTVGFQLTAGALRSFLDDLEGYRQSLRKGSCDELEFQLFSVVERSVKEILGCKTVEDAQRIGGAEFLSLLERALNMLSSQVTAKALKDELSSWHDGLRDQFAQLTFKERINQFLSQNAIDWGSLSTAFFAIQASDITELEAQWSDVFPLMLQQIYREARLISFDLIFCLI